MTDITYEIRSRVIFLCYKLRTMQKNKKGNRYE